MTKAAQTSRDELWHPGWLETDGEPRRRFFAAYGALKKIENACHDAWKLSN